MTSSIHMARQLQRRCDHSHVHQQLVGGRRKDAAYYPLPLIRAMLQGMRDTAVAESKDRHEQEELIQTLGATCNPSTTLPNIPMAREPVKTFRIKNTQACYRNITYDNSKLWGAGEYTGEVLQDH